MVQTLVRSSPYIHLPLPVWLLTIILSIWGAYSPNPLLTPLCVLALPLFAKLLWRRGEPPVLFFVVAFQWLEVTLRVFHANTLGVSVQEFPLQDPPNIPEVKEVVLLGLAGLLVLALGMRIGTSRLPIFEASRLQMDAMRFSLRKVWKGYLISIGVSLGLMGLAKAMSPLKESLLVLANFRWAMFFILAYMVLYKKQGKPYLLIALIFEIIVGFTGYFSKFTYVLYVLFLAASAIGYRFTMSNLVKIAFPLILALFLATFWMTVKPEYRSFLSGGVRQQAVTVPVRARLEKLFELGSKIKGEDLQKGFESLLIRISYVDMFAHVLRNVPRYVPYEKGKLWLRAVKHIFMPRIFFPDKPALGSDSEMTMKYTLLYMAGEEEGTSVSIGYMAESYIDFGPKGMFFPIFLLGLLWGFIFRYLVTHSTPRIFGYALSLVVLINVMGFGSNNAKLLGGVITGFIVMAFASKFIVSNLSRALLTSPIESPK